MFPFWSVFDTAAPFTGLPGRHDHGDAQGIAKRHVLRHGSLERHGRGRPIGILGIDHPYVRHGILVVSYHNAVVEPGRPVSSLDFLIVLPIMVMPRWVYGQLSLSPILNGVTLLSSVSP